MLGHPRQLQIVVGGRAATLRKKGVVFENYRLFVGEMLVPHLSDLEASATAGHAEPDGERRPGIVLQVCRLPVDFHNGSVSSVELLRATGAHLPLDLGSVADCIGAQPELVNAWARWSEDKRTTGWFLDGVRVGYYADGRTRYLTTFDDPILACAVFIVREVDSIAHAKADELGDR